MAQVGTATGGSTTGQSSNPGASSGTTYGLFEMAPQGSGNGQFNQPRGIATAPDGSYYVVDTSNMRIQKFDKTGKFVNAFGSEGSGDGQFSGLNINGSSVPGTGPGGIAVDAAGNVYVADTWNHRVQKFDKDGNFVTRWGCFIDMNPPPAPTPPAAATPLPADANARFYGPRSVAVGSTGEVYVSDTGNKRVLVFDAGQAAAPDRRGRQRDMGASNGARPAERADGHRPRQPGQCLRGRHVQPAHQRLRQDGHAAAPLDDQRLEPRLGLPGAYLAIDGADNIYATDPASQTVYKFDPNGKLLGSKNANKNVTLVRPTGITVSKDGDVIVVDTEKNGVLDLGQIP